jgi:hypothetical protein
MRLLQSALNQHGFGPLDVLNFYAPLRHRDDTLLAQMEAMTL